LAARSEDWRWSSARTHLTGKPDGLTDIAALAGLVGKWRAFLDTGIKDDEMDALRSGERTGRPAGEDSVVRSLESRTGCDLARRKVGQKPAKRGGD
jgi:putative transposase